MFGEMPEPTPLILLPEAFSEILVLRSFSSDDKAGWQLTQAMETVAADAESRFQPIIREVSSRQELIDALNAYDGAMVVVDMHGSHHGPVGTLRVGSDDVDVWRLRGEARMPPIAVLSACDTHALDRSHATPANGFIHCGSRAVLATLLPIDAPSAAVFVSRLALRARNYTAAFAATGRYSSWTQVVSGMLRMQFATDLLRHLLTRKHILPGVFPALSYTANALINPHRPSWFEDLCAAICEVSGVKPENLAASVRTTLASSDVIRYIHIGAPESLLIGGSPS
jgi:hypothetical protein